MNKERLDECLIIPTFVSNELVVTNVWCEGCLSVSHSAQVGAVLSPIYCIVWLGAGLASARLAWPAWRGLDKNS